MISHSFLKAPRLVVAEGLRDEVEEDEAVERDRE